MNDFRFYNPTKIYFGKNSISSLEKELKNYSKNILFAYGGGSIKKNGIYDEVIEILKKCNKNITELCGIMPNPTLKKVEEGIKLVKDNNIDFILAVGGGSTIDCVKAIAIGSKTETGFWNGIMNRQERPSSAVPIGTILTMVGTASEMNSGGVITNEDLKIKSSFESQYTFPKFSILNPEYTYTLPKFQMVSGVCDVMSHLMEVYFSETDEDNLSDNFSETIMKSIIRNVRIALKNPTDFNSRSNIMWSATNALNGLTKPSKSGDWQVHLIEHQVAAYYDIAHGMGLAAISPSYYRTIFKDGLHKFKKFAINVWEVSPNNKTDEEIALDGINCLEKFFEEIGATTKLSKLEIPDTSKFEEISNSCYISKTGYKTLTHKDILDILLKSF